MKSDIHPDYHPTKITCVCGNEFETRSAGKPLFKTDVCSKCHPFYTGEINKITITGRVEKFVNKYNRRSLSSEQKTQPKDAEKA